MFTLVSDNSTDISQNERQKINVIQIPFYISFDGENFLKEEKDITLDEFYKKIKEDKTLYPKTSQPSPGDYEEVFRPILEKGEDIITLTISSKLSGSYQSAMTAAEILKEEFRDRKILVLDSMNVSVGANLIVRELARMRDDGLTIEEAFEKAKKISERTRVYFTIESLEYLKKGGRIGPASALVGGLLNLRPILQIADGLVSPLEKVRGKKMAFKVIKEAALEALKDSTNIVNIAVGHINDYDEAKSFKEEIEKELKITISAPIESVGATIGAHVGPGALIFGYCRKYENV